MQKEHKTSPSSSTATKSAKASDHGPLPGKGPWIRVDGVWYTKDATGEIVPMKADTSGLTKSTPTKSARSTTAKVARSNEQGPLPGKGPWFRLDGVWYTQDEAGEWVIMPGQPKAKGLKRLKPVDVPS